MFLIYLTFDLFRFVFNAICFDLFRFVLICFTVQGIGSDSVLLVADRMDLKHETVCSMQDPVFSPPAHRMADALRLLIAWRTRQVLQNCLAHFWSLLVFQAILFAQAFAAGPDGGPLSSHKPTAMSHWPYQTD